MKEELYGIQLLDEVKEFIPVMTSLEIGMIVNGLLKLTPENLAHWQRLLNGWALRREEMIKRIERAYAKQR